MSPELAVLVLGFIGVLLNQYRNDVDNQKRHDKLKNDNIADKAAKLKRDDEHDSRRDKMLNTFTLEFRAESSELGRKLEILGKELQTALIDNARLEEQLKELIRNQGIDRGEMERLSNRVHELETDKKRDIEIINKQEKTIDEMRQKLSDSNNMISGQMLKIQSLEAKLSIHNGVQSAQSAEISVPVDKQVETHISNVQTAKTADNSIDDKKDNE
jgi:chromosome segregation ATPase